MAPSKLSLSLEIHFLFIVKIVLAQMHRARRARGDITTRFAQCLLYS